MDFFTIDVSQPLTLTLILAVIVLLIWLGKEIKKSFPSAISLFIVLALTILHSIQLNIIPADNNYAMIREKLFLCIGLDAIMIFITFFGYLWIDDISAKFYKKKSIDNSLDWFWKKI